MNFNRNSVPVSQRVRMLEEALASTTFTLEELEVILDSELDPFDVVNYITAVRRNRMN